MRMPWKRRSSTPVVRRPRRTVSPTQDPHTAIKSAHNRILDATWTGSIDPSGYSGLRSPAQTTMVLSELSNLTDGMDHMLARVDRYLRREQASDRLTAVEGMFTGEADAAVATTHVWLEEATVAARQLREAIDNAQIASSGLARSETARSR